MSHIEITSGKGKFMIGVPFACHGFKCEKISEKAGRMLNELLGGGTLIVREDDGSMDRKEFEAAVTKVAGDVTKIEIRSYNDNIMEGEDFIIQNDQRRSRIVINVNEKFDGDDAALRETMSLVALELDF